MLKTLIKSRLRSNKYKPKIIQELSNTQSFLPPNLQSFNKNYYQETALLNIISSKFNSSNICFLQHNIIPIIVSNNMLIGFFIYKWV